MGIVEEAFSRLFPEAAFAYAVHLRYSGRFKPYNATVRKVGSSLYFNLSRSWKSTSEEIVIGLIQHLLVKILRKERFLAAARDNSGKTSSLNMQLYDDFIKGISEVAAVNNGNGSSDESLESSFARVNEKYFLGIADKPNLRWGLDSFRKLASYDYHTNTITVSNLFRDAPQQLLDYLMYHELLHKKLKFSSSGNGRAVHHSREFRALEQNFDGNDTIEDELNAFIRGMTFFRKRSIKNRTFSWRRLLLLR
ncbi:M48 family metallopeptidase [Candidatus Woesearchaeota archaeon]|nr:M48 family metallopeptidase [Candidatus Woesearchaeota archaeon]